MLLDKYARRTMAARHRADGYILSVPSWTACPKPPSTILLTMVDNRTNYAKDISALVVENYGSKVRIFENSIPMSVRAAEISAEGVSIYEHDPNGKVASAYQSLTEEVLTDE